MNNKIKKILTTSLVSAMTITTLSAGASKLATPTITETVKANVMQSEEYLGAKDNTSNRNKIGKIVETSLLSEDGFKTYTRSNGATYLSDTNEASSNSNQTSMGVFVLSESPYITLSNDNNGSRLSMYINFSKDAFAINQANTNHKTDISYCLKQSILMMYTNELYNGNITLSTDKQNELESLLSNNTETSSNIDSIIDILESGLTENSLYYGKNLSSLATTLKDSSQNTTSEYKTLADKIVSTFKLQDNSVSESPAKTIQSPSNSTDTNSRAIQNTQTDSHRRLISSRDNQTLAQNNQDNTTNQSRTITQDTTNQYQNNTSTQSNNGIQNTNQTRNTTQNNSLNQNNRNSTTRRNYYNRQNLNNPQNNTSTQNTNETTMQADNNQNSHRTLRTDRTSPSNDYISSKPEFQNNSRPRATRMPYNNQSMRQF